MIDNQEDRAIASHRSGALRAEPQGSRAKPPAAIAEHAPELLEALKLADALLRGANMNRSVVERKVSAALANAAGAS